MYELLKGEVYDFYLKDENFKQFSKTDLAEKILMECGLNIKKEDEIAMLNNGAEIFCSASKIVLKRLVRLVDIIQSKKKGFLANDPRRNDVFFDLRDFPELMVEDISQATLSQSSTSSRLSVLSDLEIEIPSQPRRKKSFPFLEVGPKAKTIRTKEIFELLLDTAEKENLAPEKLVAYLGYRVSYQKNKKLANIFKEIFEDRQDSLKDVEPSQALYIREHCQIGRRIYTGFSSQ